MNNLTRRSVLGAAVAVPLVGIMKRPANAAKYTYRIGTDTPISHPINVRAQEACARIQKATDGVFDLKLFPNNQLGGSSDMISQTRTGALDFVMTSGGILSPLVPAAAINGVGFAFKDYGQVWQAMDGAVGAYVREEISQRGLIGFEKIWDNGFRHVTSAERTIKSPDDLERFKIRVPLAPLYTSMFKALGSSPTGINLSEVYSALQTKLVDGQENPVSVIISAKFYEVQKNLALTGHIWDGAWVLASRKTFDSLPGSIKDIVIRELNRSAEDERADVAQMNASNLEKLKQFGMNVTEVDQSAFRATLRKAGFYSEWHKKFGDKAWSALESVAGSLS